MIKIIAQRIIFINSALFYVRLNAGFLKQALKCGRLDNIIKVIAGYRQRACFCKSLAARQRFKSLRETNKRKAIKNMKRIVCYGDSNTWGYNPENGDRFLETVRWPSVMSNMLGMEYSVVEEGLNGRTTVFEDPTEGYRNGADYLMPCLMTNKPVDLLIIMLGTNDIKPIFNTNPFYITKGMAKLVDMAQKSECGPGGRPPKILVAAPIEIGKNIMKCHTAESFHQYAPEVSRILQEYYAEMAEEYGVSYINAAEFARPSEYDAIHMEEEGHMRLAQAMAKKVKEIL
jgi:lysophospholipase L1-like esterase